MDQHYEELLNELSQGKLKSYINHAYKARGEDTKSKVYKKRSAGIEQATVKYNKKRRAAMPWHQRFHDDMNKMYGMVAHAELSHTVSG